MADRPVRQRKQVERFNIGPNGPTTDYQDGSDSDGSDGSEEHDPVPRTVQKKKPSEPKMKAAPKEKKATKQADTMPLYDALLNKQTNLQPHVDGLIARWQQCASDEERQVVSKDVLTVILRVAGASQPLCDNIAVGTDFGNKEEMDAIVDDIINESDAVEPGKEYAVLQTAFGGKPSNETVRARLQLLIRLLASSTSPEHLAGTAGLAEYIMDVALPLSGCTFVPLRHAASLVCSALYCALLDRSAALDRQRADALAAQQNQASLAAALTKKKGGVDAAVHAKALKDAEESVKRYGEEAEGLLDLSAKLTACAQDLINGSVPNRYRDDAAGIRVDTLQALGSLMQDHPGSYLTNGFLKYLGWMLNDRVAGVRAASLRALCALYGLSEDLVARTNEFMTRFKGRVADMTRDVDDGVAEEAVRLLHASLKAEQLTEDEINAAREALLSSAPKVRAAAGAMLMDFFPAFEEAGDAMLNGADEDDDMGQDDDQAEAGSKKGKAKAKGTGAQAASKAATAAMERARKAKQQLEALVETALQLLPLKTSTEVEVYRAVPSIMHYLVTAFWPAPRGAVLCNWDAYRLLLLGSMGDKAATGTGAGASGGEGTELNDLQVFLALRMLFESAGLATAVSVEEAQSGVHTKARAQADAKAKRGAAAAGGSPVSAPAAAESTEGLQVTASAQDASGNAMSTALAFMLPDLLSTFGSDAVNVPTLVSLVSMVRPATYSSQAGARLVTSTVHQLGRLLSQHTSETALDAIGSALLALCVSDQPRHIDSRAAVAKLVTSLTSSLSRLVGKLTGAGEGAGESSKGKKGSKGKAKAKPEATDDAMDEDTAAQEEEAAASPSGMARYTAQQARRLRVLADLVAAGDLDVSFPEFEPSEVGSNALLSTLDLLLKDRRELAALFDAAGSSKHDEEGYSVAESLETLCPALMAEGLRLYTSIFAGHAARVSARAVAAHGAMQSEKDEVEGLASNAANLRDKLLAHVTACMRARHPVLLAEYCARAEIAPGSEELDSQPVVAATYAVQDELPMAENVYILRVRQAAYHCLMRLGMTCSRDIMNMTLCHDLAWSPGEVECALIGTYVNTELDHGAMAVVAEGAELPGAATGGAIDGAEAGEDEDLDAMAEELGEKLGLGSKDMAQASQAVRVTQVGHLSRAVEAQRVSTTLRPLVDLALACYSNDKIGSSVVRRLADELNEAGSAGIAFSKAYAVRVREAGKWKELMAAQLRSVADGVKYIAKMVMRMRAMEKERHASEEAQAQYDEHHNTTLAAVEQLTHVVKQQVAVLGRGSNETVRVLIAKSIVQFAQDSLEFSDNWPWRTVLLAFIIPYLTIFPANTTKKLFHYLHERLHEQIQGSLPAGGAEAEDAWQTAEEWWINIATASPSQQAIKLSVSAIAIHGKTMPTEPARPWMPAAALLWLLKNGSNAPAKMNMAMTNSLRAYSGSSSMEQMQAAPDSAPGEAAQAFETSRLASSRAGSVAGSVTGPARGSATSNARKSAASTQPVGASQSGMSLGRGVAGDDEDEDLTLERRSAEQSQGSYLSFQGDASQSSATQSSDSGRKSSGRAGAGASAGARKSSGAGQAKPKPSRATQQAADDDEDDEDEDMEEDDDDDEDYGVKRRPSAGRRPSGSAAPSASSLTGLSAVPSRVSRGKSVASTMSLSRTTMGRTVGDIQLSQSQSQDY